MPQIPNWLVPTQTRAPGVGQETLPVGQLPVLAPEEEPLVAGAGVAIGCDAPVDEAEAAGATGAAGANTPPTLAGGDFCAGVAGVDGDDEDPPDDGADPPEEEPEDEPGEEPAAAEQVPSASGEAAPLRTTDVPGLGMSSTPSLVVHSPGRFATKICGKPL